MHLVEEHYTTTIDKYFSIVFGIWPHDESRFVLLRRTLIITLGVLYICLQFSVFITSEYTLALFVRVMSFACLYTIILLMYVVFTFKMKAVVSLHNEIQEDWKMIRDKIENDIIEKNARDNQYYIILIFSYIMFVIIALIIVQFLPVILDAVLPLDEPRPRHLLIAVEYFVSQTEYFYPIVLHEIACVMMCAAMTFATSTRMLLFIFHAFGMYKLARHRIQYCIEDCVLHVPSPEKERAICRRIMHAAIAYSRALKFSTVIPTLFNVPYCVIAFFGVILLSINIYSIVESFVTSTTNIEDILMCVRNMISILVYMFVTMIIGQTIIEYNNDVFNLLYSTSWYLMPVSSQKLLLFLMRKASKNCYLTIGFIFVAKIESFATLLNTALSYVTVMYSCSH